MTVVRPRMAFISTVFLFPNDAGGKIRTTNMLRGLKGGLFEIILMCPASSEQQSLWSNEIREICDEFLPWNPSEQKTKWLRAFDLLSDLPVNIKNDKTAVGVAAVKALSLRNDVDLVVFDFLHAAVLRPDNLDCATVCFTHNVEAEIFGRHVEQAQNIFMRFVWKSQYAKMQRFERQALAQYTAVIAVSERDAAYFSQQYGIVNSYPIPTGVDLNFFSWAAPPAPVASPPTVVFTGSMSWIANINGVGYFLEHIWPLVYAKRPDARFLIVGRDPPDSLLAQAQRLHNVEITGFVDDVRPYVHSAQAFVIPLLIGGGTRIKAFEAMAMGCPVVSTSIGIEGLDVSSDEHYLCCDTSESFAQAVIDLLNDADLREGLSIRARSCVEKRFSHTVASEVFEKICWDALNSNSVAES